MLSVLYGSGARLYPQTGSTSSKRPSARAMAIVREEFEAFKNALELRFLDAEKNIESVLRRLDTSQASQAEQIAEITQVLQGANAISQSAAKQVDGMQETIRQVTTAYEAITHHVKSEIGSALEVMRERVHKIEERPETGRMGKNLLNHPKALENKMTTFKGEKNAQDKNNFFKWRENLDNLILGAYPGLEDLLDALKKSAEEATQDWYEGETYSDEDVPPYKHLCTEVFKCIKRHVESDAQTIVEGANKNGLEAYRKLSKNFESHSTNSKGQLLDALTHMVHRKAKDIQELTKLVRELEAKTQNYRRHVGEEPSEDIKSSILSNLLDPSTRKEAIRTNVLGKYKEMQTLIEKLATEDVSNTAPMDIGAVDYKSTSAYEQDWQGQLLGQGSQPEHTEYYNMQDPYQYNINALGKGPGKGKGRGKGDGRCFECGLPGHFSRECHLKRKGK